MAKFSMEFLQLSLVTLQLPEIFSHAAMNKLDVRTGFANHTKHFRDAVRHVLVIPSVTEINQRHLRAGRLFGKNGLRPLGQKGVIVTGILPGMAQLTAKPAVAVIIGKPVRDDPRTVGTDPDELRPNLLVVESAPNHSSFKA